MTVFLFVFKPPLNEICQYIFVILLAFINLSMTYPETFEHKVGFESVRARLKKLCVSELGSAGVDAMSFTSSYDSVCRMLGQTAEMLAILTGDETFPLGHVDDLTTQLNSLRVPGSFIVSAELQKLQKTLSTMGDLVSFFKNHRDDEGVSRFPWLDAEALLLKPFPVCLALIDRVIDRFGNVKDGASPDLAQIRSRLSSMSGTVNSVIRRVMAKAVQDGIVDSDASPSMRDGRLVIPVAPMHKRKLSGIVHDESASGKTVFIEPAEVVEINNRIRELEIEERREIVRILTAVADELRPYVPDIIDGLNLLGVFDFIQAKARYANEVGAQLPTLSDAPEVEWYHACHPVLKMSLMNQGKEIVPLDIALSRENRILIISGPNAGGKSVCLKTVGIVQYMTQCGLLPIMYENSRMGLFDDILIDIGDDQSIEDDLSTYSSHLKNMKYFLSNGGGRSLMLIDEFGSGTEPQIGGAIAQAILQRLNEMGMWGVITTHYQNLKHFAEDTDGLINGSMLYDRHRMQPLFKLSIGNPGSSFAVEIARKIGLSASIIEESERIVGSDYVNMDKYLLDIARDRRYWDNKRSDIKHKEKKLEQLIEQYRSDAETLRERRREIIEDAKTKAQKILDDSNAIIERTISDIRRSQAEKERTMEARKRLAEDKSKLNGSNDSAYEHKLLKKAPKPKKPKAVPQNDVKELSVGDMVKLDGQGSPGEIVEISGKNATVVFGMIKTTVKLERLRHTSARPKTNTTKASFVSSATADDMRNRQLNFKNDIDVRGMRVDEAVQAVTYFIDDAVQFNSGRVRILHGTGTGALRQSIRQYLDTVPDVKSYRDEHVQFGGAGITVVDLK